MKLQKLLLVSLMSALIFGCNEDLSIYYDDIPPATPTNIRTITGDNMVEISWKSVYNSDLSGYAVYWITICGKSGFSESCRIARRNAQKIAPNPEKGR